PAAPVEPGHACQHPVAIEHQAHLRRGEEQVVAAIFGNEETETVAVPADAAADEVQLVHRGIRAAPGVDHLAIALHGAQTATQRFELLVGGQTEFFDQLLAGRRGATLVQSHQNQFAAGNGVIVLLRLADGDRKSTRLNSSHVKISYAVFCLKKKTSYSQ